MIVGDPFRLSRSMITYLMRCSRNEKAWCKRMQPGIRLRDEASSASFLSNRDAWWLHIYMLKSVSPAPRSGATP